MLIFHSAQQLTKAGAGGKRGNDDTLILASGLHWELSSSIIRTVQFVRNRVKVSVVARKRQVMAVMHQVTRLAYPDPGRKGRRPQQRCDDSISTAHTPRTED